MANWSDVARRAQASSRTMLWKLRGRFGGCCAVINWTQTWTLRVCQMNCFADSSGNCPDASRLLRQPPCAHSPVLREMFPGNCSDTARLLPGDCPDDSSGAGRMLRGHSVDADWSWTGCGCGHRAGHSPASAWPLSVHARTFHRMMYGHCATCCLTHM